MAKFYVQSGSFNQIVTAEDAEAAALEALDQFFASSQWVFEDPTLSDTQRRDHLAVEALLHLDSTVQVSERGFRVVPVEEVLGLRTSDDPKTFDTADLIDIHFRLAAAMRRFLSEFSHQIDEENQPKLMELLV